VTPGANIVNNAGVLLNRIAEFRRRLETMPRLMPADGPAARQNEESIRGPEPVVAGSRAQAIIENSLRQLATSGDVDPPPLAERARRLLIEAHGLVTRLKALADEPLLDSPRPANEAARVADPLVIHFRETAALAEAAVRYAATFPPATDEQTRLCEGLEGLIDAGRRRFELLAGAVERRRTEEARIDRLARFLLSMDLGDGAIDPAPILDLADTLLAEEPGRPMRWAAAHPTCTQAYLGGADFPAPARFVAAHSLNCASVLARVIRYDAEWRPRAQEVIVAALVHDVGMLRVDPAILAHPRPLDMNQRKAIERHAADGAERILERLPGLSPVAEVAATHHERADGTGYPNQQPGDQISPLSRLVAAADVYAAMCAPRPHRPALDPRAALADTLMLAERGRLDRYAAERLLALGLYPYGTVVELSDGSTAVVLMPRDPRVAFHAAPRPLVGVLADADRRVLAAPRYIDLADAHAGTVVRALEPAERLRLLARSYPEWA
jgi:HD-GYP domain-containing protein (c-di-GMP phosphodiesterase class II)